VRSACIEALAVKTRGQGYAQAERTGTSITSSWNEETNNAMAFTCVSALLQYQVKAALLCHWFRRINCTNFDVYCSSRFQQVTRDMLSSLHCCRALAYNVFVDVTWCDQGFTLSGSTAKPTTRFFCSGGCSDMKHNMTQSSPHGVTTHQHVENFHSWYAEIRTASLRYSVPIDSLQ